MDGDRQAPTSAFAPLAHRAFAVLWGAAIIANVGTWMRDVGLGWTMTELSPSATLVAAVQAAAALPAMLLAVPAGALADVLDRRRLLIASQAALMALSWLLAGLALAGLLTPSVVLLAALLGGIGAALSAPAWQAIVPQLVPRDALRPAIALNALGVNIARAVGPALGGLVLATAGAWAVFALDALSFVGILLALTWWRPPTVNGRAPSERVVGAMRAGLRYARHSPELRRVLLRAAAFFPFSAAPWALLPLVARGPLLGGGPNLYGILLAAIGLGAVAGALLLPVLRARLRMTPGGTVLAGTFGVALAAALLGLAPTPAIAALACAMLGLAWIAVLTALNVATQTALPEWARARGLALYLTVFSGGMMMGGVAWGGLAEMVGIPAALAVAAALGATFGTLARRLALPESGEGFTPNDHMPGHEGLAIRPAPTAGPVVVMVEYRLRHLEDAEQLFAILVPLGAERQRDGASSWRAFADPADPLRVVEVFTTVDWAEHERMHARASLAARVLHAQANAFDSRGQPVVRHLVAMR